MPAPYAKTRELRCQFLECRNPYTTTALNSKYCPEHPWSVRQRELKELGIKVVGDRPCARHECENVLEGARALNKIAKYCSRECMEKVKYQTKDARDSATNKSRTENQRATERWQRKQAELQDEKEKSRLLRAGPTYEAIDPVRYVANRWLAMS